ncbi:MAG: RluA family pseudouridine synthase [Bacteroides sp.]|nr:RluA family pseudouridine synthase [Bacteroides sp.]
MTPVYEDNHIIIVSKEAGEIVQGDRTGDRPLSETVALYLKEKYRKPGNVFIGVVHRIDRPVSGLVIFAKTSKALSRLNEMLRRNEIHKTYWALVEGHPENDEATLECHMRSDGRLNKSFVCAPTHPEAKKAVLHYRVLSRGDRYSLLEVRLITGRKHQIRLQLSQMGHPIQGDLKYGARRSNPDGGISLLARHIGFEHPVSHLHIEAEAPVLPRMLPFIPQPIS